MEHVSDPRTSALEDRWHFTHVVRSRGLLFLSGVTGVGADGAVSADPQEQFEDLFARLREHLGSAGATVGDLVEITTYHVDLEQHFSTFVTVKDAHVSAPYPAWSAIGVTRLAAPDALIELRAVAEDPTDPGR